MPTFSADVTEAVLSHMNGDHPEDSLLIARAFGDRDATAATMTTLDGDGGTWTYSAGGVDHELTVPWPGGAITERPEIRREIVMLYDDACARLGIEPRAH